MPNAGRLQCRADGASHRALERVALPSEVRVPMAQCSFLDGAVGLFVLPGVSF